MKDLTIYIKILAQKLFTQSVLDQFVERKDLHQKSETESFKWKFLNE